MNSTPRTPEEVEQIRRTTKVKGEVICRECGRPVGDDRCGRLHDPEFVWQRISEALLNIQEVHEWRGEKWGIRHQLPQPTIAGYSDDCLVGRKGERENYCLQFRNGWRIHVRWLDHPYYKYTVHREFDPKHKTVAHLFDVVSGDTKRMRDNFRVTWSAYNEPTHLTI